MAEPPIDYSKTSLHSTPLQSRTSHTATMAEPPRRPEQNRASTIAEPSPNYSKTEPPPLHCPSAPLPSLRPTLLFSTPPAIRRPMSHRTTCTALFPKGAREVCGPVGGAAAGAAEAPAPLDKQRAVLAPRANACRATPSATTMPRPNTTANHPFGSPWHPPGGDHDSEKAPSSPAAIIRPNTSAG